jgi:DNA-binding Xre family transcriptional regulator
MSGLWSGRPISIKLDDLDVICAALDCSVAELLLPSSKPGDPEGEPPESELELPER